MSTREAVDTTDLPECDYLGGTLRVHLHVTEGVPWAVELEYRYPEDAEDEPGDKLFIRLGVLVDIAAFVKERIVAWRERTKAVELEPFAAEP